MMHQRSPVATRSVHNGICILRCRVSYLLFLNFLAVSPSTSSSSHCLGVQHRHKHLSTMAKPALSTHCAGPLDWSDPATSFTGVCSQLHRSAAPAAAAHCTSARLRLPCRSSHQLSAASSKALTVIRTCKRTCLASLRHVHFLAQRNTYKQLGRRCRQHAEGTC